MSKYPQVELVLPKTIMGKAKYKLMADAEVGIYTIPAGFVSDGSTVPRLFWGIFPAVSSYFWATVLHDYLLSIGTNRMKADIAFKEAMAHENVSKPVIFVKLFFVTIYGFIKKPKDYL